MTFFEMGSSEAITDHVDARTTLNRVTRRPRRPPSLSCVYEAYDFTSTDRSPNARNGNNYTTVR